MSVPSPTPSEEKLIEILDGEILAFLDREALDGVAAEEALQRIMGALGAVFGIHAAVLVVGYGPALYRTALVRMRARSSEAYAMSRAVIVQHVKNHEGDTVDLKDIDHVGHA